MSETHAQTVSYVRDSMLPEQAPPITETGAIKWIRENLFSSWLNGILTVISIYVIYVVLAGVLPWLFNSVWGVGSLTECREVLDEKGLGSHDGACFSVLNDRWHQLVFGYYPSELYWRPVLALILFLVGIMPVLFTGLPRKMFILTAAVPFICFWLLWGGSIWGPIAIALGFALGFGALKVIGEGLSPLAGLIAAIVVPLIYWLYGAGFLARELQEAIPIGIEFVESRQFGGFMLSVVIGLSAIILSLPLGILLALGRQSDLIIIKTSAVVFIEVIRGVPLIVWLFTAQLLLNYFLPPGTNFDLTLRVIIMVTLFASAYIAEVVRGGLAALPTGQYEGADSLGLDYWQSMQLIILPQALKISIPGIVNTFIGLFKDTTLVVFIGLFDPLGIAGAVRATTEWNGIYWELFVFIGLMFFIACFSMGRYSLFLEKKLQREHR
ncbi:amino acid ABC transporter permease [Octadecabacter sp. R77987]|uniref:amino acid ABC transporter permease n=1 Tax=Octadecabacter sp. R77987 TaxID=3093874 RepID=UPI00366CBEAB